MEEQAGMLERLSGFIKPWLASIENPAAAQEQVLQQLLKGYAGSQYGRDHHAEKVASAADFRRLFPITTYEGMKPLIQRVMEGEFGALLSEPPVAWGITRGTTSNERKFIPLTRTSLASQSAAGRAVLNFAYHGHFNVLTGVNLNLNFPSVLGTIKTGDLQLDYGYSSGIYTKHVSTATPVRSLPTQAEIDALGGDQHIDDWNRRFELAYERCKDQNVSLVGGVAPTAVLFGQHLYNKHHIYPRELWRPVVMTLGSVPGINTKYRPTLRGLYGTPEIREIYGATEAILGQQMDEVRAWTPNYDLFYFEVVTKQGVKPLSELRPGEYGSMVVSTSVFPRYRLGDVIVAGKAPYFRCIGREGKFTRMRYWWDSAAAFDFGQI
jgi:hypothetical protein